MNYSANQNYYTVMMPTIVVMTNYTVMVSTIVVMTNYTVKVHVIL